jgi:ligand-binding sensor domain-containing protein
MTTRVWVAVILCAAVLSAQGYAAVGTWKNYTSMKEVRAIARDGHTFWAATSGGLFSWNSSTQAFTRFTSAEGLYSTNLTATGIDRDGNVWTGTETGVVHVYDPSTGAWRYVLDIANTTQPNKQIRQLSFQGDTVFICTDFGMSIFRRSTFEFGDTYAQFDTLSRSIKPGVSSAVVFNDSLWLSIATTGISRVAVASLATPNLVPPEAWRVRTISSPGVIVRQLALFNGQMYGATSAGLFVYDAGLWLPVASLAGMDITGLSTSAQHLAIVTATRAYTLDTQGNVQQQGGDFPSTGSAIILNPDDAVIAGSNGSGLLTLDNGGSWTARYPNGPNSNLFVNVVMSGDGVLWAASGSGNGAGIYRFDGTNWQSFTTANSFLPTNNYYRVSATCNGSVWASSWGWGVVEFPAGATQVDSSRIYWRNVGLVGIPTNPDYVVASNVVCDPLGNAWLTVIAADDQRLLAVKTARGVWERSVVTYQSTRYSNLMDGPTDKCLAIDAYGSVWAAVRQETVPQGLISMGNRGNTSDTTVAFRVTTDDGLPSNGVTTIVSDLDGQLWVGTDRGIAIINNPLDPKGSGGMASYTPLRGTTVNCITVDALNQKWVGTSEGVVVLSSDGTQQIASYTLESTGGKLINNDVKSIAVDGKTGTAYFGTIDGLASVTTASVTPNASFGKLQISPNPLIVPGSAQVTIDGLVENSQIKILTIDGRVVRLITPPAGRIGFWDGRNDDGEFVASGVYVVVASSEKGDIATTGKIAVIRR